MNKYLTNKTRLFFIQYPIVERSHKETSTPFACFVTPSALKPTLILLWECPHSSRSTIPKCLSSFDKSCATYVISSQPNSGRILTTVRGGGGESPPMSWPLIGLELIKVCLEVIKAHRDLCTGRQRVGWPDSFRYSWMKRQTGRLFVFAVLTAATDGHLHTAEVEHNTRRGGNSGNVTFKSIKNKKKITLQVISVDKHFAGD